MLAAKKKACVSYSRRRPELTPCYKILQEHLDSFIFDREAEGRPLPEYVIEEFEAYMRCGIPAYGFLRVVCNSCDKEKIVAFSCKKRGFCPSCCAKRMGEAATHLVENVLPLISYRQFVISFPIPMRYWLQTNKKLYSKIHRLVIEKIHSYYSTKAIASGIKDLTPGSISFTQRWGSALNLNPHMHVLCADGVYIWKDGKALFRNIPAISDKEVAELIESISDRVMSYLKRKGYLDKDGEVVLNPLADELFQDHESISLATSSSIAGRIAFGPNAGKYVTRIGKGFGYGEEIPLVKGKRCYSINGFSLHANTAINPHNRDRLYKLIQYIARGPLSNERLSITAGGKVLLKLKTPWSDGTNHLLFSPSEFIEKLAALIPPPRSHLVRWSGCFAPNSPFRKAITLKPEVKKGFQFVEEDEESYTRKNYSWSKMLAKVFKVDVAKCEGCGGEMRAICAVMEKTSVVRYLKHLGIDYDPPARSPPKYAQDYLAMDQSQDEACYGKVIYYD